MMPMPAIALLLLMLPLVRAHLPVVSPAFSSGMVLQREPRSSRIFGSAPAGSTVQVVLAPAAGHSGATVRTTATSAGTWVAALPPQHATKGRKLTISSAPPLRGASDTSEAIELNEISFGEVLLCAGQSNMAVQVGNRLMMNQSAELAAADLYDIKLMNNGVMWPPIGTYPNESWVPANASTLASFSNLCWLT